MCSKIGILLFKKKIKKKNPTCSFAVKTKCLSQSPSPTCLNVAWGGVITRWSIQSSNTFQEIPMPWTCHCYITICPENVRRQVREGLHVLDLLLNTWIKWLLFIWSLINKCGLRFWTCPCIPVSLLFLLPLFVEISFSAVAWKAYTN